MALDVAVVVAGVALLVWGIVVMAAPTISCLSPVPLLLGWEPC
ncbi:hypothetical protein HMPREF9622_01262 [Cutibacterium modestum HL037PA3]|nr:hypothetical protein HMPREF9622_01262 [Cutibacterium modestum HL037PA3]